MKKVPLLLLALCLMTGCSGTSTETPGCEKNVSVYNYNEMYITDDTPVLGTAAVSFPFSPAEEEAYGIDRCQIVYCGDDITVPDLFNVLYWGSAGVYTITEYDIFTKEDGWRYDTYRFYHGMSEEFLEIYGEESDKNFRKRREYMYMTEVLDDVYLILTFTPESPALPEESSVYNKIVSNITVSVSEINITES